MAAGTVSEARKSALRAHVAVMEVLEDESFMATVAVGLAESERGQRGKSFEEIDRELGAGMSSSTGRAG